MNDPEAMEFPINEELDLHTFRPSEFGELVPDYLELCHEKGYRRVRIIHIRESGLCERRSIRF